MNLIRVEFGVMISMWFCYVFDMVYLWLDYGLDMALDVIWYGSDMVWERSAFSRVPDGLASRKETETAPGQAFGRFLEVFCGFDMILIWS